MRIAIGGLTGCGKTTLGKKVAEALGLEHLSFTFKDLAKEKGVSLMEFQRMAEQDPEIDKKFDRMVHEKIKNTENFVITTWLGPWFDELFGVKYDLKVWLSTPEEIKSKRLADRDGLSQKQASRHLKERDEENRERYLHLYHIDIFDTSGFDLFIDNGNLTPEESVELILECLDEKAAKW